MTCRSVVVLVIIIIILSTVALGIFIMNSRRKEGFIPIKRSNRKTIQSKSSNQTNIPADDSAPRSSVTVVVENTTTTDPNTTQNMGHQPIARGTKGQASSRGPKTAMTAPGPIFANRIVMKVDDIASLFDLETDYKEKYGVTKEEFNKMVTEYKQQQKSEPPRIPRTLTFDIGKYNKAQNNLADSVINHADKSDPVTTTEIMQTYLSR